ncbi:hypothetical protein NNJEOMEG_03153 [Fundidesulfovibrio magnetotacticus]|uniref:Uncharacterized protein n=1 Tax=Fundidesulfovibrio magnetotacticus TaxID=2730080 RepID=A0A6V8LU90_9BACT|nr:hypothetical protein NNJEOMEG_03153 [Fundidesulfovibrio magnetotacticus]
MEVAPSRRNTGSWKCMSSESGDSWRAEEPNVITERQTVSMATGSQRRSASRDLMPWRTDSIFSPAMEPEMSTTR